jgi:hypothetical protein
MGIKKNPPQRMRIKKNPPLGVKNKKMEKDMSHTCPENGDTAENIFKILN